MTYQRRGREETANDLDSWQRQGQTRRRLRRWSVNIEAVVWLDDVAMPCTVIDLSPAGARLKLAEDSAVRIGAEVQLELDGFGSISSEVRYSADGILGLMFLHGDQGEVELARYLVARRPQRQSHRREVSLPATLTPRRAQSTCVVEDVSRIGASVLVEGPMRFSINQAVVLAIRGFGEVSATVRRVGDGRVGLLFEQPLQGNLPM